MDGAQIGARDGSWFIFADWQGVTRIAFPGDKVKTDSALDRPGSRNPLILREDGTVWHSRCVDIDPVTLKKVKNQSANKEAPDPRGSGSIEIGYDGASVKMHGTELGFVPEGEEIALGGTADRRMTSAERDYDIFPDGSLVVSGYTQGRPWLTFVTREADGTPRVAWCRHVARVPGGAPDAFLRNGALLLADRDPSRDQAFTVEIKDGVVIDKRSAPAVAGPWVHEGLVWWQPSPSVLCAGEALGTVEKSFELFADHVGPGRLLRVPGRTLFLPWHGVTIVDLAPAKKGKSEISRKHKAADEPLYKNASRLLRPIGSAMAKRGVRVKWCGVVRSGKRIVPRVEIEGPNDLVTYILAYALQDGSAAALRANGVTSMTFIGGNSLTQCLDPAKAVGVDDLRALVAMLDAAGINRAAGFGYLHSLAETGAERGVGLPWTKEAEAFALAVVLSGVRGDPPGEVPPASAEAIAAAVEPFSNWDAMEKAGINRAEQLVAVAAHRLLGEAAAAPMMKRLEAMSITYLESAKKLLGVPFEPYVSPPVPERVLSAEEASVAAELERVLGELGVGAMERESKGWYRFNVGELPFQAGINQGVLVVGTLCATSTDVDLGKLSTSLKRANRGAGLAKLEEADCYISAKAQCSLAEADAARLRALIDACRDVLVSDEARVLASEYRTVD